jgi:hypothetical protein
MPSYVLLVQKVVTTKENTMEAGNVSMRLNLLPNSVPVDPAFALH